MRIIILITFVLALLFSCSSNNSNNVNNQNSLKSTNRISKDSCNKLIDTTIFLSMGGKNAKKSLKKALIYCNKIISNCSKSNSKTARQLKGAALFKLDSLAKAIAVFDTLIKLYPNHYNYYFVKGVLLEKNNDSTEANSLFKKGISMVEQQYNADPTLRGKLGLLYYKLFINDKKDILEKIDSLKKENPNKEKLINFVQGAINQFDKDQFLNSSSGKKMAP